MTFEKLYWKEDRLEIDNLTFSLGQAKPKT